MTRKAKTLDEEQFAQLLLHVQAHSSSPQRDKVMLLLGFKCGLRACEIARLLWRDVQLSDGTLLPVNGWIELSEHITKGKKPDTRVLMHKEVHDALAELMPLTEGTGRIVQSDHTGDMTPNAVTVYLHRLYKDAGFRGCSSHSGRRTFITNLSRVCNQHGASIKDVQTLARHSDIRTTEKYIEPAPRLIELASAA